MKPLTICLIIFCITIFAVSLIESYGDNQRNNGGGGLRWWKSKPSFRARGGGGKTSGSGQSSPQSSGRRNKQGGSQTSSGQSSPERPQTSGYQKLKKQSPEPQFAMPGNTKCEGKCRGFRGGQKSCSSCCTNAGYRKGGNCDKSFAKTKCVCNIE